MCHFYTNRVAHTKRLESFPRDCDCCSSTSLYKRSCILIFHLAVWFSQSSHCLMSIWSLLVSVGLICCIGSVHSQSCFWDSDCDGGICCLRGNWFNRTCSPRGASCPCQFNSDCKSGERCNWLREVCEKRNVPYFPTYKPYTFNIRTINVLDVPTFDPFPDCVLDSDCFGSSICKDGQCRHYSSGTSSRGLLSGGKLMGIVLTAIVATIISCIYYACKRSRKPPNLPSRNVNINAPPTGVEASRRNDHEMQAGNVGTIINLRASDHSESTNSTVVVVEDETPLPPGAPPPYSSLKFEARQGSESLSDQSPPSYDEAIRNLTST